MKPQTIAVMVSVLLCLNPTVSALAADAVWQWGGAPSASRPGTGTTFAPFLPFGHTPTPPRARLPNTPSTGTDFVGQWLRMFPAQTPTAGRSNLRSNVPWLNTQPSTGFNAYSNPLSMNWAGGMMTPMLQGAMGFMGPMMMNYAIASVNPTTMNNFMGLMAQPSTGFGFGGFPGFGFPTATTPQPWASPGYSTPAPNNAITPFLPFMGFFGQGARQ